jgi:hypothetical protein
MATLAFNKYNNKFRMAALLQILDLFLLRLEALEMVQWRMELWRDL